MNISNEMNQEIKIVRLAGRLDASAVRSHRDELKKTTENLNKWMVLNMEEVDFIDSSGLGLIVSLVRNARENDADVGVPDRSPVWSQSRLPDDRGCSNDHGHHAIRRSDVDLPEPWTRPHSAQRSVELCDRRSVPVHLDRRPVDPRYSNR